MRSSTSSRIATFIAAIAIGALVAGCIPKRVLWSPDGQQAAVLGENGLYLCDTNGKISALLVPDVMVAGWFSDSRRIAVVRHTNFTNWSEIQPRLTQDMRDRIVSSGQTVVKELKSGTEFNKALATPTVPNDEKEAMALYLLSLSEVQGLVGPNWSFLQSMKCEGIDLLVGNVAEGKITLGRPLFSTFHQICEVRVSPGGQAIAFVIQGADDSEYSLHVVPADGSSAAQLVAEHCAWYPDWSTDGRSLVYIKSATQPKKGEVELTLGSLARSQVISETGRIELKSTPEELAGLLYYPFSKVRCLVDGRIIFSTATVHLPSTATEMPERQQLYALDPSRQSTLTPLIPQSAQASVPEFVCFFEPSPDGKRVSIYGEKGEVVVLTLASGKVDEVQSKPESSGDSVSVPVWRSNDELSFISFQKSTNVVRAEVTLWRDGTNRVISAPWPDDVREKFLDKWVVNDAPRQDHLNQMRDK